MPVDGRVFPWMAPFFGLAFPLAAFFLVPPALILPWFDGLDKAKNFTLGYVCVARKPLPVVSGLGSRRADPSFDDK